MSKEKETAAKTEETAAKTEETAAKTAVPAGEEFVEYMAPLLGAGKQKPVFVAVNGETLRIQRGVPVKIKRKFVTALRNADAQAFEAYQAVARAQAQGG